MSPPTSRRLCWLKIPPLNYGSVASEQVSYDLKLTIIAYYSKSSSPFSANRKPVSGSNFHRHTYLDLLLAEAQYLSLD